jgi:hypothetical protein
VYHGFIMAHLEGLEPSAVLSIGVFDADLLSHEIALSRRLELVPVTLIRLAYRDNDAQRRDKSGEPEPATAIRSHALHLMAP